MSKGGSNGTARRREYIFTAYLVNDVDDPLAPVMENKSVDWMTYQLERCPTTQRLHGQGCVHFNTPKTMKAALRALLQVDVHGETHGWVRPQERSNESNVAYCNKDETRVRGPWTHGTPHSNQERVDPEAKTERDIMLIRNKRKWVDVLTDPDTRHIAKCRLQWTREIFNSTLRPVTPSPNPVPWLEPVVPMLASDPVPRRIIWIQAEAATGKSTFLQWLRTAHGAQIVQSLEFSRVMNAHKGERIIAVDTSRTLTLTHTQLETLEFLSNGGFQQSPMYGGAEREVRAHIVVASNYDPDLIMHSKRVVHVNKPAFGPVTVTDYTV